MDINPEQNVGNPERSKEELLHDRSKLYHGIGFDLIRMKRILEHGILSENAARQKGLDLARNYGGYNLNDTVSVSESPSVHNTFTFGAFSNYIKPGISFVIGEIPLDGVRAFRAPPMPSDRDFMNSRSSARASGYIDEAYIVHEVPLRNIQGVMIPEEALTRPVSELPVGLAKMGYGYIDNRCRKIVADLEHELGYKADTSQLEMLIKQKEELEKSEGGYLEKDTRRKDLFSAMERVMQGYIGQAYSSKMGKKVVTLGDVMREYLPKSMQVYNSEGIPIDITNVSDKTHP